MSLFELFESLPLIVLVIVTPLLLVVVCIYTLTSRNFGDKVTGDSDSYLKLRSAAVLVARSISPESGKLYPWSNLPKRHYNENRQSGKTGLDKARNPGNEKSDFFYLGVFYFVIGLAWGLVELCQFLLMG
jgi:hypothetical protein